MNRATKRLMAKQEAAAEKERARKMPLPGVARGSDDGSARPGRGFGRRRGAEPGAERESRLVRMRKFLREVRVELKKVAWPSRSEVFTYTVVVLVSVTFVTLFVFALDFGFGKAVLQVFKAK